MPFIRLQLLAALSLQTQERLTFFLLLAAAVAARAEVVRVDSGG
jgi:hypothetical protein